MVTLMDVAREAGTSYATVSRALNGKSRISAPTRKRVREIARRLGYRPNYAGRALRCGKTNTIGLILPCYGNPHHDDMANAIQAEARARGQELAVVSFEMDANCERACLESMLERKCDGIIAYLARFAPVEPLIRRFWQERLPCVVLGLPRDVRNTPVDAVDCRVSAGIGKAIEYLVGLGHAQIAMVIERIPASGAIPDRILAFRRGLRRAGRSDCSRNIVLQPCTGDTVRDGYESADALLQKHPDVTAVIAMNDLMATGLLRRLHERGRQVPEDISVVGTDDTWIARTWIPTLTSINLRTAEAGRAAVELLLERLDRECWDTPRHLALEAELVIRESTGPARQARLRSSDSAERFLGPGHVRQGNEGLTHGC